jgi:hypothetical protein
VQEFTIGEGDDQRNFEGKKLDEKILGTGPDDTKKIAYYETLEGKYLKHTIHGINKEEDEQSHEIEEVTSFEIP